MTTCQNIKKNEFLVFLKNELYTPSLMQTIIDYVSILLPIVYIFFIITIDFFKNFNQSFLAIIRLLIEGFLQRLFVTNL